MKQTQQPATDALEIFRRHTRGNDPARARAVEQRVQNIRIGQEIYRRRKQLGLSQKEVARRVGTTASAISRMENAEKGPTATMLQRLADALDCQPADFLQRRAWQIELVQTASITSGLSSYTLPLAAAGSVTHKTLLKV